MRLLWLRDEEEAANAFSDFVDMWGTIEDISNAAQFDTRPDNGQNSVRHHLDSNGFLFTSTSASLDRHFSPIVKCMNTMFHMEGRTYYTLSFIGS